MVESAKKSSAVKRIELTNECMSECVNVSTCQSVNVWFPNPRFFSLHSKKQLC